MIAAAVRRMVRGRRVRIWCGVALAFGIGVGFVPLFGVLGYELALAASLVAAVCGLDLGAAFARELQTMPAPAIARSAYPGRVLAASTVAAASIAVCVMVIPAIACAIRGIWRPTCDWWFGIEAYALLPLCTAALAGPLGHAIGVITGVRTRALRRPHRGTVIAIAVPLVVLAAAALWRFYSEPPVFVYSAIIGYFPGNLYDENLHLGAPLLWSRLEQLAFVIALVAIVATRLDVASFRLVLREPRPAGRRVGILAIGLVALAGAITLHAFGGTLGFAIDEADIEDVLDGRLETAHFVIHYARTPEIEADLQLIAADHEFRYAEVVAQLGMAPAGKLTSLYFASTDQKARWLGPRNVEMSKPWRRDIYVDHRPFPHFSLRHEIAHAVASSFGDPIFGVATSHGIPNPGMIEGLAVAIDWPGEGSLTPHEQVRAMQLQGFEPSIGTLFSLGFFTVSSTRGYSVGGSFMRFLLDRYGAEKLRALYHGGDFSDAYGKSRDELEGEWRQMISSITLPADVIEGTRERFRATSVFSRPCPHAIAARREAAQRAAMLGEHDHAIRLMRDVCRDAPEEPAFRVLLASVLYEGTHEQRDEALRLWSAVGDDETVTSSLRAAALERLAKAAAARGDRAILQALVERAAALPVEGDQRRQLEAQTFALAHGGAALYGYFFAPGGTFRQIEWAELAVLGDPELGFAHYLLGLQHFNEDHWAAATSELSRALDAGLPGVHFNSFGARQLAVAAYRAHDAAGVNRAITALRGPGMSQVDRLLADDWAQRLVFDKTL
jgi:hypothetical protein